MQSHVNYLYNTGILSSNPFDSLKLLMIADYWFVCKFNETIKNIFIYYNLINMMVMVVFVVFSCTYYMIIKIIRIISKSNDKHFILKHLNDLQIIMLS